MAIPGTRERQPFAINDVTPEQAVRMLRTAAYGDLAEFNALFDEMVEHDGHLFSVSDSRRLALTGLPWEILTAAEPSQIPKDEQAQAEKTAEFCKAGIRRIKGFHRLLDHMQQSVDRGLQIAEVEWGDHADGGYGPIEIHPLLPSQIKQDPQVPGRILIVTPDDAQGVPLDEQAEGKFIVMHRYMRKNNPFVSGLMLMALMWHMYTRWGMRWWGAGLERFGLPILIGEYLEDATEDEKEEILGILEDMGANGVGIIRKGTEFKMHHAAMSGRWPHQSLMAFADAQKSKLWLGATLTVEQGEKGSQALGREHQEVKRDRLQEDVLLESAMLDQLLGPMVRYEFGPGAWTPCFRRALEDTTDLVATSTWLGNVLTATGVKPTIGWVVNTFGIQVPKDTKMDAPVPGGALGGGMFSQPIPNAERIAGSRLCGESDITAHRALETIVGRRASAVTKIVPWIFAAVLASRAHTENVLGAAGEMVAEAAALPAAIERLPELVDRLPIEEMVELNRQLLLASQLAGMDQARVRIESRSRRTNSDRGTAIVAHAESIDFDDLPFLEAIEAFRERLGLAPETFLDLDAQARSRAWRVAGVWDMRLLSMIHRELTEAIETGQTTRDFRLRIPEMAEAEGWSGANPWHADLVHFQNSVMAFSAGQHRQAVEFGVPAWRFVGRGDSCPICLREVGQVYSINDTDRSPPLHFMCDCEREDVFEDELPGVDVASSDRWENEALVASRATRGGFKWDVRAYADLEPLDLASFPEELRAAFRAFGEGHGWEIAE